MVKDKYTNTINQFELYYPSLAARTVDWWASGRISIIVKLEDDSMYDYDPMDNSIRQIYNCDVDEHADEEFVRKGFGNNLQKMLPFSGMNKSDLAAKVGISTVMLSKYIHGKGTPSVIVARKIAKALGCTVDDLFDDTYIR